MPQKRHFNHNRPARGNRPATPESRLLQRPPTIERQAAVVYGKPFVLLEDGERNTFIYKAGNWIPHTESIAQCRETCQVKQLPQSLNRMIRYEIRCPQ